MNIEDKVTVHLPKLPEAHKIVLGKQKINTDNAGDAHTDNAQGAHMERNKLGNHFSINHDITLENVTRLT
jgi:hypothetical protein